MPQEIERKFLVNHTKWQAFAKPLGEHYRQGYLLVDPAKTIRVRVANTKGFLTIKGATVGATRAEFEYEIPIEEAKELLDKFAVSELSKIRYTINYQNKIWEVDEFLGDNDGLIVAEIELQTEEEYFETPNFISEEVTNDIRYYNSNLTTNPYKNW